MREVKKKEKKRKEVAWEGTKDSKKYIFIFGFFDGFG